MNKHPKVWLLPQFLIRMWRLIKSNPKKVWLSRDFYSIRNDYYSVQRNLWVLIKMDLIEVVPAVYRCPKGGKYGNVLSRNVKGYRLKQMEKEE